MPGTGRVLIRTYNLVILSIWGDGVTGVTLLVKKKVGVLLLAVLLLVAGTASATDLRITDSRGTELVVQSAAIDYGGFMASELETQGIRLMQGDGSVMVKWT